MDVPRRKDEKLLRAFTTFLSIFSCGWWWLNKATHKRKEKSEWTFMQRPNPDIPRRSKVWRLTVDILTRNACIEISLFSQMITKPTSPPNNVPVNQWSQKIYVSHLNFSFSSLFVSSGEWRWDFRACEQNMQYPLKKPHEVFESIFADGF